MEYRVPANVNLFDEECREKKKSPRVIAVVAGNGHDGLLLWYKGSYLESLVEEEGFREASNLFEGAPKGVWVYDGTAIWQPGPYEYPLEGDFELNGDYRAPTEEEWLEIRAGRNPFEKE